MFTRLMMGLVVAVAALVLAGGAGLVWRARNGKLRARTPAPPGTAVPEITAADIGAPFGARATLVQFSTAFCSPCRATRQILADVSAMVDGVAHVDIDAESHLDLVRRLDVRRTPTVFVLGADGRITHRASGQPRKADVIAAIGALDYTS